MKTSYYMILVGIILITLILFLKVESLDYMCIKVIAQPKCKSLNASIGDSTIKTTEGINVSCKVVEVGKTIQQVGYVSLSKDEIKQCIRRTSIFDLEVVEE